MELNVNVLSDFVRNAEILWAKGAMSVPQFARSSGLFREVAIPQNSGNTREFSEVDLEEYASKKGESDQHSRARVQQGYSKTGRLYRVTKSIGISYEMRSQGKYEEMTRKLTNLGKLAPNKLDLDLTHRLTFGTSTTYTDADGDSVDIAVGDTLALFSTVHTLRASSSTFRNRLANNPQFSPGALDAMRKMRVENCLNQFGEKMVMKDDIIWSSEDPATVRAISETLRSSAKVDQSNPGVVNTDQASLRHVILPRLATTASGAVDSTKAKYWGVASSEHSTAMLGVHEEAHLTSPSAGSNAEEFSTDDWNFKTAMGYMIAIVSASWLGFSSGDATA